MTEFTALIIEDSSVQAQLISRLISAQPGWTALHFPTFREGFEALSQISVQAVFMDIFVGNTNGIMHVEAFRKRCGSTVPIILMTAGSAQEGIDETLRKARLARADFVLRKPFGEPDIRSLFETAFGGKDTAGRKSHILLIEDSRTLRGLIKGTLEFSAYRVSEAESMEAAFRDVNIAHVDLVICDVFMPGMGGLEGIRHIKQTWPSVPVIAMSGGMGTTSETDALRATEKMGADACLPKPFQSAQLLEMAAALMRAPVILDA
ncbi:MAG: response regulator [Asticcacaulis sp.]